MDITIIGGGMITHDVLLPAAYQLQRTGVARTIRVCARHATPLRELVDSQEIREAFPHQSFQAFPALDSDPGARDPLAYRAALEAMAPRQAVVVATPDPTHHDIVMDALDHDQHVLCVKPLVLTHREGEAIREKAMRKGLLVGVEYHKRFDRRALLARRHYRAGDFGEFAMGEARMIEPYFYRESNFQNWFTADQTDPFVYVGCHYVDLVRFITGLRPVAVSVSGIDGRFPNGHTGTMWANGRVRWENGALLSVIDGLGYPDDGAASNDQGLLMYCEGDGRTGMIEHDDQFRGLKHSYVRGDKRHRYINPDFFRYVPWEGDGLKPIGYGVDSVCATLLEAEKLEREVAGLDDDASLEARRRRIREIDAKGFIATPANSFINELVHEAARLSITHDGDWAVMEYGNPPSVRLR